MNDYSIRTDSLANVESVIGISEAVFNTTLIVFIVAAILNVILFFKIWRACNDTNKIKNHINDSSDDMRFWMRAKYESDKRLGIINDADIKITEEFIENK